MMNITADEENLAILATVASALGSLRGIYGAGLEFYAKSAPRMPFQSFLSKERRQR